MKIETLKLVKMLILPRWGFVKSNLPMLFGVLNGEDDFMLFTFPYQKHKAELHLEWSDCLST